jgi:hypothetical protein
MRDLPWSRERERREREEREEREPGGDTWKREQKTGTGVDYYAVATRKEPVVQHCGFVKDTRIHKFNWDVVALGAVRHLLVSH